VIALARSKALLLRSNATHIKYSTRGLGLEVLTPTRVLVCVIVHFAYTCVVYVSVHLAVFANA